MRGHHVQGGIVSRAVAARLLRGDLGAQLLDQHRVALLLREVDPGLHVVRVGRRELDVRAQGLDRLVNLAGHLLQGAALGLDIVQRRDLLRLRQVVARLRLVRVRDGRGADLEIALGLRQLLGDRHLLPANQAQRILRREHLEIGHRHAHDQVLGGLGEDGFGLLRLQFTLVVLRQVLRTIQRLRQRERIAIGAVIALSGGLRRRAPELRVEVGLHGAGAEVEGRQHQRAPLRQLFLPGLQRVARPRVLRVVGARVLVHLAQVLRQGGERGTAQGQGKCVSRIHVAMVRVNRPAWPDPRCAPRHRRRRRGCRRGRGLGTRGTVPPAGCARRGGR